MVLVFFDSLPTNLEKLLAQKTCDIIHPSSQGYGGYFCYKQQWNRASKIADNVN